MARTTGYDAGFHDEDDEDGEEARTVRPYTVTGGRTRSASSHADLPLEALVRALGGPTSHVGLAVERRKILELTSDRILSVAELSAHLKLPLGVTRVLVGDLAADELVVVHGGAQSNSNPATDLKLLESVLNGISAL